MCGSTQNIRTTNKYQFFSILNRCCCKRKRRLNGIRMFVANSYSLTEDVPVIQEQFMPDESRYSVISGKVSKLADVPASSKPVTLKAN